jgi:hypothetical protein
METLMRDSNNVLVGLRHTTHRKWFTQQAGGRGLWVAGGISEEHGVDAYLNHGRWIADCPLEREGQPCGGAECVTEDDKVFFCLSCGNAQVGGNFLKVRFPPKNSRNKIEKSLAMRPESLRNWNPGETPAKIAEENRQHGIVVPEGAE